MAPIDLHNLLFWSKMNPLYDHIFVVNEEIYWNSSSDESNRVFSLFFTFVTFDGIPCPGCPPGITEPLVVAIPTELPCFEVSLESSCVFTSPYCSVFLCRLPPAISIIKLNDNCSRIYQWAHNLVDIKVFTRNLTIDIKKNSTKIKESDELFKRIH